MEWEFCIDESGDFGRDLDVCVLGVLVERGGFGARVERVVQQALQEAIPWFDWPLHQRVARHPVANLVQVRRVPERAMVHPLGAHLLALANALDPTAVPEWRDMERRFADGREPSMDALSALEEVLCQEGHRNTVGEARRVMWIAWPAVLEAASRAIALSGVAAFVVPAAAMELAPAPQSRDRYLDLLAHAVRRAAHVLLAETDCPVQRLTVSPLQRQVWHPVLGQNTHMDKSILADVLRKAGGGAPVVRAHGREVQLHPGALLGYRQADLGTGWVLADLLAAEVRTAARRRSKPWAAVSAEFRRATHLSLESNDVCLPLLAAAGTQDGGTPRAPGGPLPGEGAVVWPLEQAERWRTWHDGQGEAGP